MDMEVNINRKLKVRSRKLGEGRVRGQGAWVRRQEIKSKSNRVTEWHRAEIKAIRKNYMNGLITVRLFSITCPCCKSSVYKILQLDAIADAIIKLSQ